MKLIPALAVFTLSAFVAIPGAMSQGVVLKADIPFAFTVGDASHRHRIPLEMSL